MSQILPRFYRRQDEARRLQRISRIVSEAVDDTPVTTVARATLGGDARRLRGIPAIGVSVGGAIPGTNPEAALMGRQRD